MRQLFNLIAACRYLSITLHCFRSENYIYRGQAALIFIFLRVPAAWQS